MFDEQVDVLRPSRNKRQTGRFIYIFLRRPQIISDPFRLLFRQYLRVKIFFTPKYFPSTISVPFLSPDISFHSKGKQITPPGDQSDRFSAER